MSTYAPDPYAAAVVLFSEGVNKFDLNSGQMIFTCHKRIKILKKNGLAEADIAIPYYHQDQKLQDVRATIYNLENGNIIRTNLGKKSFYSEKTTSLVTSRKFSFPNVHAGSVIEYEYTLSTYDFTYIPDWMFQGNIPEQYSLFQTDAPSFLVYNFARTGVLNNTSYRMDTRPLYIQGQPASLYTHTWIATNVPAYRSEPLINSDKQQTAGIAFELSKILINIIYRDFASSYPAYTEKLKVHDEFGREMYHPFMFRSFMPKGLDQMKSQHEKLYAIYEAVTKNITWNGEVSMFVDPALNVVRDQKTGNSAAVNFVLMNMLQSVGITADPVIMSTRDKGNISKYIPIRSKLNYVILKAVVDGEEILLDATDPRRPAGMLPFMCMNGQGWNILGSNGWIDLRKKENYSDIYTGLISISDSTDAKVEITSILDGYSALEARTAMQPLGVEQARKLAMETPGNIRIENWQILNLDSIYKPLLIKKTCIFKNGFQKAGDKLLIDPFSMAPILPNPFIQENRIYPIDMGCPRTIKYTFTIFVPDGYEIIAIPKGENLALPNDEAKFQLNSVVNQNQISITSLLQINRTLYSAAEYGAIREFYSLFASKQLENIILKKK
jgi:hypothetical protein